MEKQKTIKHYTDALRKRCEVKFGIDFVHDNEELIECAARNKRLLDRFDQEMDDQSLKIVMVGSMGQTKEDINPIIKHRNDVAKLYADNLDALMLTPRAKYKKAESKVEAREDEVISSLIGRRH